ncbi:MAG: RNA polymerase sigma factor [Acidobacteriota bacterium]
MERLPGEDGLVRRHLSGDPRAFDAIMRHYEPYVLGLLWRMAGERSAAEDLCQETFLKVLKGLPSFRGGSSLKTWIYRIAHNVWTDRLRARDPEETGGEEHPAYRVAADPRTPLGRVEDAQIRMALEAAMADLPRAQREALHLFYWDDLSVEEVAQALSVPEGTVKTLLFRGRRALREKVALQLGGAP